MKELMKAIVEARMFQLETGINHLMDELNRLTETLESFIEVPEEAPKPQKTKQELLEDDLEELLLKHCRTANFYTEGNTTIAVATIDGELFPRVGFAKCCPTDEFNETAGEVVALRRALGLPVDTKQYGEPIVEQDHEEIEQDCYNCKYESLGILDYPCNNCCNDSIEDDELYPCWKSIDEEDVVKYDGPLDDGHDCDTCKHDATTSVNQEPCKTCLESPDQRPICWEPKESPSTEEECCRDCAKCKARCDEFDFVAQLIGIAKELGV